MISRSRVSVLAFLIGACMDTGFSQTRVDLGRQARNVDFSAASSSKPFKTGVTLPATCSQGETFFKTDAVAGENLYLCVAANTWSTVNASSSWSVARVSATQLLIPPAPEVRFGNATCAAGSSSATLTVSSGTGKAFIYLTPDCTVTVAHNVLMGGCNGCALINGTSFPPGSFPLAEWEVTNGQFAAAGTNRVTPYSASPITAGTNVQIATSGGVATISALTSNVNLQGNALLIELPNETVTGTEQNRLVKLISVGGTAYAVRAGVSDTAGMIGVAVSGTGTTGSSQIAVGGAAWCYFEGAATAGNYVAAGTTTGGACRDAGSAPPSGTQVIGRVLASGGAGLVRILVAPR